MITNQNNLDRLFIGFMAAFQNGVGQAGDDWTKIAMRVASRTREEKYAWLGKMPSLREWVGDRVINNIAAHDYTIVNKKFESTLEVSRDDLTDEMYGVYGQMFSELGFATAAHPNELVFNLLKEGFTEKCYDGQYFFDTDHPIAQTGGGTKSVSNDGGGSGTGWYLMDLNRAIKPIIFQERETYELRRRDRKTDPGVLGA